MPIDLDLLARVCEVPGAPGFEKEIRQLVLEEIDGLADDIRTDNIGNVVALKQGKSSKRKAMAAAHMDEIGFMITHIDDKGFVRFRPLGGFDPKTLTSQRVLIHGRKNVLGVMGCKPIHIMQPEERTKAPKIDVIDRESELVVRAELPGFNKDDLDVNVTRNTVTVKGSSRKEEEKEEGQYHHREIVSRTVSRTVPLPCDVDSASAKAKLKDGMLEVTVAKAKGAENKRIDIES